VKQPSVYSREQIINAAFELVREKSWSAVTTRAIAKRLGSSTMPIYSHVRSVQELERELQVKARQFLKEYQLHQYTKDALLNLAFGYVTFARDEKYLFRFIYLDRPETFNLEDTHAIKELFFSEFGQDSEAGKALLELNITGNEAMVQHTWIFTHGLAMLVNSGSLDKYSDEIILQHLRNAGEAFYTWGKGRKHNK
jgi:AcrR family transcriptional regulator